MFEATGLNREKKLWICCLNFKNASQSLCSLFLPLYLSHTHTCTIFLLELALEMMWLDEWEGVCLFFSVGQLVTVKSVN